jgi:hypothetical protein
MVRTLRPGRPARGTLIIPRHERNPVRRLFRAALLAAALTLAAVPAALANPGPGDSNQCAPGQHAGPTSPPPCPNAK